MSVEPSVSPTVEALKTRLLEQLAECLGLEARSIDPHERFSRYGLTSLLAARLLAGLATSLGRPLAPTLVWDHPTVDALARHLAGEPSAPTSRPRRAEAPRPQDEPIAVVGLACRFPKASGVRAYWRLLCDGVDAITEVPQERWDLESLYDEDPAAPGKVRTRWGGFLEQVDRFDAQFFGISPREAESMDPQQRMVLEVAWEALERAGQDASELRNTRTGVFVGVTTADYARVILQGKPEDIDAYFASGTSLNVVAGRVSYTLGLQGPAMAVDTACSSSLVALHLACQSLRTGESTMALAAGVNLMLSPESTMAGCRARMLAPDARCKTFDASANGFTRAEGCGVLVLKKLSEAQAQGDDILAVIRGTAVNQDGPSSGLTVPNGLAQQAVIRQALQGAGVAPAEVSYLEAHGTGTSLGDPIEAEAMWSVLKEGRKGGESLWMGSVKTNIGHLESAAGVAGVMKVVLALRNRQLPAHLHLKQPNPHIDWKGMAVKVPVELTPWEPKQGRRIAGVSSFGFSGTNAHVVLEEAPPMPARTQGVERPEHVLVVSGRGSEAMRAQAGRYAQALAEGGAALGDVCFTAATGRAHFEHRLAVVGSSAAQVRERLEAAASGRETEGVVSGRAGSAPKVAFVFGASEPYAGMGRQLYETQPVFREALEKCGEALKSVLEKPLVQVLYGPEGARLKEAAYGNAAVFAVEWALARLWRAWGVEPKRVEGHGVGEDVAGVETGALGLEEGLKRAVARGPWSAREAAEKALKTDGAEVGLEVVPPRPGRSEWTQVLETLGGLYVRGVEVDWAGYDAPYGRRRVVLPTYPFQRQRYWLTRERLIPALR